MENLPEVPIFDQSQPHELGEQAGAFEIADHCLSGALLDSMDFSNWLSNLDEKAVLQDLEEAGIF
ncbi:hypothetical protein COT75_03550 [Candidatus Beckwithbacteria bacterium CG10_big_fil_rev_8_21_14_0_10_34_10]|uniref:Uncharacterized protein n=1 Tax=Candidatus Beckwithbacteria bacterium CG10_big_fil_rev_8_21_14_0_10_34_10 TaxID=1974495 RepID=A0A2H0WAX0_9BACT|nr:MAG: hypothetical protein COT75_03550 [Candidatus Beckwithbacteria bacterium CG10_big_fil_rev_8_21_14_0_10_34_10]